MATIAAPTIWPLDPNGMGMLIVIIANIPAAKTAIKGIFFSLRFLRPHLKAIIKNIIAIIQ
jgi:hypothetical protein